MFSLNLLFAFALIMLSWFQLKLGTLELIVMPNVVISRGLANIAGNHHANLYAAGKGKNGRTLVVDVMAILGDYIFMNVYLPLI